MLSGHEESRGTILLILQPEDFKNADLKPDMPKSQWWIWHLSICFHSCRPDRPVYVYINQNSWQWQAMTFLHFLIKSLNYQTFCSHMSKTGLTTCEAAGNTFSTTEPQRCDYMKQTGRLFSWALLSIPSLCHLHFQASRNWASLLTVEAIALGRPSEEAPQHKNKIGNAIGYLTAKETWSIHAVWVVWSQQVSNVHKWDTETARRDTKMHGKPNLHALYQRSSKVSESLRESLSSLSSLHLLVSLSCETQWSSQDCWETPAWHKFNRCVEFEDSQVSQVSLLILNQSQGIIRRASKRGYSLLFTTCATSATPWHFHSAIFVCAQDGLMCILLLEAV